MKYMKNTMSIVEKQQLEVAGMELTVQAAVQEKQAAKLDYIAMMANIDLSDIETEEEGGTGDAEQEVRAGEEVL